MSTHVKVAIIGSGPSGYTAAIYASRAQLEPVLLAGYKTGGQLMWTTEVENFPGFKDGIQGPELMSTMRAQAERFGTKIDDVYATAVDFSAQPFKIWTNWPATADTELVEKGKPSDLAAIRTEIMQAEPAYIADSVIISTGASSIMLNAPGETEFLGRGVSTCAVCDAAFYKGKKTVVVGGGDSAMEDTLALTKFAEEITVIHRRDSFKASKIMQQRVLEHPKVKVLWNSEVTAVKGAAKVASIDVKTTGVDGQVKTTQMELDGVFIAIGHRPVSSLFDGQIKLDNHGYIVTGQSASGLGVELAKSGLSESELLTFPSMTSVPGVFAAGDVVDIRYKQAITAAGQGASAALDAERWLEKQGK
jgi:thioredoxin reductase (NADPH)